MMPRTLTTKAVPIPCTELRMTGPDGSVALPLFGWLMLTVTMSPIQRQELRRILTEMDAEDSWAVSNPLRAGRAPGGRLP